MSTFTRTVGLSAAIVLALGALSCGGASQPTTEDPATPSDPSDPKHPYAGFEAGSYVKYRTITDIGPSTIESESKTTIVRVQADAVLIETESRMPNMEAQRQQSVVSLREHVKAPAPKATGKESITVPAGTFTCAWTETETTEAGRTTTIRTWTSVDVLTHIVKVEVRTPKTKYTTELLEYQPIN